MRSGRLGVEGVRSSSSLVEALVDVVVEAWVGGVLRRIRYSDGVEVSASSDVVLRVKRDLEVGEAMMFLSSGKDSSRGESLLSCGVDID
jgi:hypothetical protein